MRLYLINKLDKRRREMVDKIDTTKPWCFKPDTEDQVNTFLELMDSADIDLGCATPTYNTVVECPRDDWDDYCMWGVDFDNEVWCNDLVKEFAYDDQAVNEVTFEQIVHTFGKPQVIEENATTKPTDNPESQKAYWLSRVGDEVMWQGGTYPVVGYDESGDWVILDFGEGVELRYDGVRPTQVSELPDLTKEKRSFLLEQWKRKGSDWAHDTESSNLTVGEMLDFIMSMEDNNE